MLLYMLPLSRPSRSTLTLMMQESDACWLYMGREVMDTERLWWWEGRGRLAAEPVAAWESEMEPDTDGVSAAVQRVGDEEAKVVAEDKEKAEVEQEEQDRVSCMLQEL